MRFSSIAGSATNEIPVNLPDSAGCAVRAEHRFSGRGSNAKRE